MGPGSPIDIAAVVDSSPVSRFQILTLTLLGIALVMDGFDVQAMSYAAPAIIKEWGLNKAQLGPVFGAGMFGMLAGTLALSTLADIVGRRPVIVWATLLFSISTLVTACARSLIELEVLRCVAGFGLAALMPNAMALSEEYSPRRVKTTLMMLVSCGFTIGGVVGGFAAAALIPAFGWRSVFVVGGIIPAIAFVLMLIFLPESMHFLLAKKKAYAFVSVVLKKVQPNLILGIAPNFLVAEDKQDSSAPVKQLFMRGRSTFTLLLWLVNFVNLIDLYFLMSWMPAIARDTGLSISSAVLLGTMFPIGGIAGTLLIGPLVDRLGFYKVLGITFVTAALSIFMIGQVLSPAFAFFAVALSGFCIIGGQAAINILAADYYPTELRSTGVGWSLGAGRVGSIAGPVVGGILMGRNWSNGSLFAAVAVPAVISAITMALLSAHQRKPRGKPANPAACPENATRSTSL